MTRAPRPGAGRRVATRPPSRVPVSTYRLQLSHRFTFDAAQDVVPYLSELGVTECYVSPSLTARPHSPHGYDITDHSQLNPELGPDTSFEVMAQALTQRGMGLVLDIVPNHMELAARFNVWWWDVLECGRQSLFANFFDIEWEPEAAELQDRVLLPILGDEYRAVLDRGEIRLAFEHNRFVLRYFDRQLPVAPRALPQIFEHAPWASEVDEPPYAELRRLVGACVEAAAGDDPDPVSCDEAERRLRDRMPQLVDAASVRRHIEASVAGVNQAGPSALDRLLGLQNYRLAFWADPGSRVNYRRFFDINDLGALRTENPDVFEATHRRIRTLLSAKQVTGLRIDHVDGLFDPAGYFEAVQALAADEATEETAACYVVAEKILSHGETLPPTWAIHGTTGYEFLNDLNGLFVDGRHAQALRSLYQGFGGTTQRFAEVVYECKKLIMATTMTSEVDRLVRLWERSLAGGDGGLSREVMRAALVEFIACLPVYRTYVGPDGPAPSDVETIDATVAQATARSPEVDPEIFRALHRALLPPPDADSRRPADDADEGVPPLELVRRVQQYSGGIEAKGHEDTAFYRHNVLLSVNEVGGGGDRFGVEPADFHAANQQRLADWPYAMLTTSTHDTKLGEDVRARLNVLSELPDEWATQLSTWRGLHAGPAADGQSVDPNDEYRLYQVLVGAWPPELLGATSPPPVPDAFVERIQEYMRKAAREAKLHTSWLSPDADYEQALAALVERVLTGPAAGVFSKAFVPFARQVAVAGMVNSLAQLVLKVASPGVPDFYQGCEVWNLSLVDPDNRRPVDFAERRRLLTEIEPLVWSEPGTARSMADRGAAVAGLLDDWPDARIKLHVTCSALRYRRAHPDLFLRGEYVPLTAEVTVSASCVALARRFEEATVLAVVPRFVTPLLSARCPFPVGVEAWGTSRLRLPAGLADRVYRSLLTDEELRPSREADGEGRIPLAELFRRCPVALVAAT